MVNASSSLLAGVDRYSVAVPEVLYTEFLTYTDGTYSYGDVFAVSLTNVELASMTGVTVTQYNMRGDSIAVTPVEVVAVGWVQYGTIRYSNYKPDSITVTPIQVVAVGWT